MGRRRDVEANQIMQFLGESLVVGEFEAAPAMRCQRMLMPDLDDRRGCNPNDLGHRTNRPVRCFLLRRIKRQCDDTLNEFAIQRRNAGRSALVAQKTIDALSHEALLPAPDAGFRFAGCLHDRDRSRTVATHQDDLRAPHVLLSRGRRCNNRFQPGSVRHSDVKCDTCTHTISLHDEDRKGIPTRTPLFQSIH